MNADLLAQAERFAAEVESLIQSCLPDAPDFDLERMDNGRIWIHPTDQAYHSGGIPLSVEGNHRGWLRVNYRRRIDTANEFLTIHSSGFSVGTSAENAPLFRFEYDSNARSKADAHIHVHGQRPALAVLLTASRFDELHKLHLPTGGARFRNGIEDVVEFLITDCQVDSVAGWASAIQASREGWRRIQLKAATRRMPETAIEQLTSMGYQVTPPPPLPPTEHRGDKAG
jgi:hypothetical protein